jgi:xylan 1,4-beta-xylosidase
MSSRNEGAKIRIGASNVGEYYTGLMIHFAFFDYVLSEEEIGKLK